MIKEISLQNYRVFSEDTYVPLKLLTVLCGANNSGKSSLLQMLLLLGGVKTLGRLFTGTCLYYSDGEAAHPGNTSSIAVTFSISRDDGHFEDLASLYQALESVKRRACTIGSFVIKHTLVMWEYYVDVCSANISALDTEGNIICSSRINFSQLFYGKPRYKLCYKDLPIEGNVYTTTKDDKHIYDLEHGPLIVLDKGDVAFDASVYKIFDVIFAQYSQVDNISLFRDMHMNEYDIHNGALTGVGSRGERLTELLMTVDKSAVTTVPLPKMHDDSMWRLQPQSISFRVCLDEWLKYFGYGGLSFNRDSESIFLGNSHMSCLGYSVYQLLPILVQCLYMKTGRTLVLAHPEAYLDSETQMKLADFLVAVAASGRQVIVETHSDHIIYRISRRVMETTRVSGSLRESVQINFVERNSDEYSTVNSDIQIDSLRGLINCPKKFFREYGTELHAIMHQGLENLKDTKAQNMDSTNYF